MYEFTNAYYAHNSFQHYCALLILSLSLSLLVSVRYEEALTDFDIVIQMDPSIACAYVNMGLVYAYKYGVPRRSAYTQVHQQSNIDSHNHNCIWLYSLLPNPIALLCSLPRLQGDHVLHSSIEDRPHLPQGLPVPDGGTDGAEAVQGSPQRPHHCHPLETRRTILPPNEGLVCSTYIHTHTHAYIHT